MSKIYGIPVTTPLNPEKAVPAGFATEEYVNEKIAEAGLGGDVPKSVLLYTEQTLTEEQKEQARENIGAAAAGEGGGGSGSIGSLTSWEIVQSTDAVTLHYTLEDGREHTDVIALDANGYPNSITHDGITAPGTWRDADV